MTSSGRGVLVVALLSLVVTGCQSSRMAAVDTRPEPLPAAPTGAVASSALPPPAPAAPAAPTTELPQETQTAAVVPAGPPPNAPDLTPATVGGVWTVAVSGQSCKIATSQTKFGSGFRAGPLRCPAPVDGIKSWNVAGKQLSLYDETGAVTARLYSSGPEKFDGQTETGVPISFSR